MKTIPTLSTLGIPMNPAEFAKKLIQYYNESNYSQSNLFFGTVRSLAARIMEFQHDSTKLSDAISRDLKAILSDYFTGVDVTVTAADNTDGTYDLTITGTYLSDGTKYDIKEQFTKKSN